MDDWFDYRKYCGHLVEDWRCLLLTGHPGDHEGYDAWCVRASEAIGAVGISPPFRRGLPVSQVIYDEPFDWPTEEQVNDWNIHNDHADGIEEEYDDEP